MGPVTAPRLSRGRNRRARDAAAAATSDIEYFHLLAEAGIVVRLRAARPADSDGYAIGLPDHRTIDGQIIYYSGSRLAPDLGLGRLRHRWQTTYPHEPVSAAATA